jgi:hypothetical protein
MIITFEFFFDWANSKFLYKGYFHEFACFWALCLVLNTWHAYENDNQVHTCCKAYFFLAFKISVCLKLKNSNVAIAWYPLSFCFSLPWFWNPSVKIGDCVLWLQKWLSMLALMLTICCTSQIVWHQSSMQKPLVCSKCCINFFFPIVCFFFCSLAQYPHSYLIYLNLLSQSLEVIVV